jgi:hypothetical protein
LEGSKSTDETWATTLAIPNASKVETNAASFMLYVVKGRNWDSSGVVGKQEFRQERPRERLRFLKLGLAARPKNPSVIFIYQRWKLSPITMPTKSAL